MLNSNAVFLGYLKIRSALSKIPSDQSITFNRNGYFTDYTISELCKEFVLSSKSGSEKNE